MMTPPPAKVLVLGVDAANPGLFRRWAEEGVLPNTRDLLARGTVGPTTSVEGFFVGATWPSFYTGVTPARHGCHYLTQLRSGTYDFYNVADHGVSRHEPFWNHLSRAGKRVAVLDVPLTQLDSTINGIQVVEWGAHDAVYGFRTSPASLKANIEAEFGLHPFAPSCDGARRTAGDYERLTATLADGARLKGLLTRRLLRDAGWDFFMQVFTEGHCAGHQCWHLHDPAHPAHDRQVAAQVGDPLRRVYTSIDCAIGDIVRDAGGAVVLLVIAHGMSEWYGANFLLPVILHRLGVTRSTVPPPPTGSPANERARRMWRRLPAGLRNVVSQTRSRLTAPLPRLPFDPKHSLCFPHSNGQAVSGIRLNQTGREPEGTLRPEEAAAFCDRLTRDLLDIVDDRGRPLVRRVLLTRDVYSGEFIDDLPDLLVEWSDTASTSVGAQRLRVTSPGIGLVDGLNEYTRTGDHRQDGMFIAAGPRIGRREMTRTVSILDFAPTLTSLLNVPWQDGDGQAIVELLN